MQKDFYTIHDIAEQLQVQEKAVRRIISIGKLPASKMFNKWIVSYDDLHAFYKANKKIAEEPMKR